VALDPTKHTAYVTNFDDGTVSVIDTSTNTVTATLAVGSGPFGVAFDLTTHTAYVANRLSNTVSVIVAAVTGLAPTITGLAQVGQTLTAHEGTVDPADAALTYQWSQNGNPINNATASTYKLKAAQAGKAITVTITASKSPLDPQTATSTATPNVREKVDSPQVKLDGSTVTHGSSVGIHGQGLVPGTTYTVRIDSTTVGTFTADQYGEINGNITVPSSTKPGIHIVTVTAPNGKVSSTTLVVK
jgi:YVTN family beta-propeller protein